MRPIGLEESDEAVSRSEKLMLHENQEGVRMVQKNLGEFLQGRWRLNQGRQNFVKTLNYSTDVHLNVEVCLKVVSATVEVRDFAGRTDIVSP